MKQDDLAKAVNECLNTDLPFNTDFIDIMTVFYHALVDIKGEYDKYRIYDIEIGLDELIDSVGELTPSTYGDDQ